MGNTVELALQHWLDITDGSGPKSGPKSGPIQSS